ncbi:MAG: fumarylacetoacetate hydrolase family protein [Kiritimatiellae bacterium]|nr:fumarylacetoacetate hydrolase family protein [Kiritimatiellia bacterium]
MRLVRFGPPGRERPGIWLGTEIPDPEARILDVNAMAFDIHDYDAHFFSHWGLERLAGLLKERDRKLIPAQGVRLGPPVPRPFHIICLGANYAAHAAEFGSEVPANPVFFAKSGSSLSGPFDPIVLPRGASVVDAEVELALVIGRETARVPEDRALECVAGFMVLNDVTDRVAQRQDKQWFRAKSYDTFCPAGPFLVTSDEAGDPHALRLYAKHNGETLQAASTSDMIFKLPRLISELSARMTLRPGDVIATGTPPGIGSARNPPRVLAAGDTVEVGVEGLGSQRSPVTAEG